MRLVWHIVRKDVRRMFWPTCVWVGFLVLSTTWFGAMQTAPDVDLGRWMTLMETWSRLAVAMKLLFAALLTGVLVLEDPLIGGTAFWATRPIGGARLLAAKMTGALLMFAIAPALALLPVWLALGLRGGAIEGGLGFMAAQSVSVLFSVMVATLTRTLAQFFLAMLLLTVALGGVGLVAMEIGYEQLDMATRRVRAATVRALIVAAMVAVGVHQFLTRRTARSWGILGAALAVTVLVGWSWPASARTLKADVSETTVRMTAEKLHGRVGAVMPSVNQRRHRVPTLLVRTEVGESGRIFLPSGGAGQLELSNGKNVGVNLEGLRSMPESVALAEGAGGQIPAELTWHVRLRRSSDPEAVLTDGMAKWKGVAALTEYRRTLRIELPLREGATAHAGSNACRMLSVALPGGDIAPALMIEERDSWVSRGDPIRVVMGLREGVIDCYLLRLRDGTVHVLTIEEVGAAVLNSVARGMFRMGLSRELMPQRLEDARLVKVRFERVRKFNQAIPAAEITVVSDQEP